MKGSRKMNRAAQKVTRFIVLTVTKIDVKPAKYINAPFLVHSICYIKCRINKTFIFERKTGYE